VLILQTLWASGKLTGVYQYLSSQPHLTAALILVCPVQISPHRASLKRASNQHQPTCAPLARSWRDECVRRYMLSPPPSQNDQGCMQASNYISWVKGGLSGEFLHWASPVRLIIRFHLEFSRGKRQAVNGRSQNPYCIFSWTCLLPLDAQSSCQSSIFSILFWF
jgi:hypothetical protein